MEELELDRMEATVVQDALGSELAECRERLEKAEREFELTGREAEGEQADRLRDRIATIKAVIDRME